MMAFVSPLGRLWMIIFQSSSASITGTASVKNHCKSRLAFSDSVINFCSSDCPTVSIVHGSMKSTIVLRNYGHNSTGPIPSPQKQTTSLATAGRRRAIRYHIGYPFRTNSGVTSNRYRWSMNCSFSTLIYTYCSTKVRFLSSESPLRGGGGFFNYGVGGSLARGPRLGRFCSHTKNCG